MLHVDAAGTSKQKAKACCTSKPDSEGRRAHVHLGLVIIIVLLRCEGPSLRVWLISLVDNVPCFAICTAYGYHHHHEPCDQVQPADADLLVICFLAVCAGDEMTK